MPLRSRFPSFKTPAYVVRFDSHRLMFLFFLFRFSILLSFYSIRIKLRKIGPDFIRTAERHICRQSPLNRLNISLADFFYLSRNLGSRLITYLGQSPYLGSFSKLLKHGKTLHLPTGRESTVPF